MVSLVQPRHLSQASTWPCFVHTKKCCLRPKKLLLIRNNGLPLMRIRTAAIDVSRREQSEFLPNSFQEVLVSEAPA